MEDTLVLSVELKRAIQIAQSIAKEYSNSNFSPAHLLKALLHKDVGLVPYLQSKGKDIYFMEEWADVRIEGYPKGNTVSNPTGDDKIQSVIEDADNVRIKLSKDEIDTICILGALATPGIAFSYDQLKTFPVNVNEILNDTIEKSNLQNVISGPSNGVKKSTITGALQKYCIDKTMLAREGKLEAITGRDKEIRMVLEILGRRSKPNVIIMGEPGVGKSALINGFVSNVMSGKVPDNLKNAIIFELDNGSFIAGATYKGEAEERFKNIVNEISGFDKAILFIDNIHTFIEKDGPTPGLGNLFKTELSKGQLTIIGITTNDQYRKHIEGDEALSRLFETVGISEPDETTAVRMLKIAMPHYEKHHKLTLDEETIVEAIGLAKRYMKERSLPDSAIDLIDRTMSAIKMMAETTKDEISLIEKEIEFSKSKKDLSEEEFVRDLKWIYQSAKSSISSVIFGQVELDKDINQMDNSLEILSYLDTIIIKLKELSEIVKNKVEKNDIAAIVSHKTGIPLGKLQSREKEKLMNMESDLKKRVVGQDHAVKAVCEAILESRSGLSKPGQPIGSFFLLGPTGTGKTELAKSLAEFLFNDESALTRFDMSEFKEEHSAALLYGAPPGYVGYEEGGLLVNKIRQKPYSIVLFDEIEKAHPSVFDLFLQIMDEGKLHDRLGKEGSFSNAVILFTSNIGSDFIIESFNKKQIPKPNDLMEIMTKFFRPEFLARLTEIVPFSPITEEIVLNIFTIQLKSLLKSLERQGVTLEITDKAKDYMAKNGFNPKYGARPLSSVIRMQIRRPLSRMLISGELVRGQKVVLDINDLKEPIWSKS